MYLENVVFDATNPQALGRLWESRLGTETLTDVAEGFETRLEVPGWPYLDLCFQRVPDEPTAPQRLRLDVTGEPETLAALVLESADPARDREFWAWLTGWSPVDGDGAVLRHPSLHGPVLELVPEWAAKGAEKNPVHLDVRLEAEDADAVAEAIADHGGRELHLGYGDLPWRHYADPSGNELCVLRAHS